jgi:hypothetical protein
MTNGSVAGFPLAARNTSVTIAVASAQQKLEAVYAEFLAHGAGRGESRARSLQSRIG